LPDGVRVDNGSPWGSPGDLPTALSLWLCGLRITSTWNPPRQPQYNGVVERSNRLVKDWAEPGQCPSVRVLQQRIDREDQVQRETYPACEGRSRIEAYPALRIPRRRYTRDRERRDWDLELVKELLSHYAVPRHVDGSGKIGLYGGKLYVGTRHKRTNVLLQFDPMRCEWVISNRQNQQLARVPAETISKRCILNLNIRP
jgi:hypothetical protein